MILYDNSDWFEVIFTYFGTVWSQIRTKFIFIVLYAIAAYAVACYYEYNFGSEGRTILFGTMSFLLIFRANQAYTRYWQGRCVVSEFFSDIRDFIMLSLIYIRGGLHTSTFLFHGGPGIPPKSHFYEDAFDLKATELRINVVRLCVALAVSFKLHTRIALDGYCFGSISGETKWLVDWDRLRLLQLLTVEEFRIVDACMGISDEGAPPAKDALASLVKQFKGDSEKRGGPPPGFPEEFEVDPGCIVRPPVVIVYLIREVIMRNMNDPFNSQPWGLKDRFIPGLAGLLTSLQHNFEMAHQIITTPLPLPYANLCKTLLSVFLFAMPFFVDYRLGWFANTVIPAIVSLALLGIDAIATELENPFGDDANDLDILEGIHVLEREAMEMLRLAGDKKGVSRFVWRMMPAFVRSSSCRDLKYQIAVEDLAAPEVLAPMSSESAAAFSRSPPDRRRPGATEMTALP
mmetsp:Transcript_89558/g.191911  ORF Transcript_89558/g.191911 Transcript_89558/m.191911 type:complete len:460 (-) Transcript_89558:58-1437(-)